MFWKLRRVEYQRSRFGRVGRDEQACFEDLVSLTSPSIKCLGVLAKKHYRVNSISFSQCMQCLIELCMPDDFAKLKKCNAEPGSAWELEMVYHVLPEYYIHRSLKRLMESVCGKKQK